MDWGNAFVRSKTVSPTGLVTALKLELHLEGDFKKTKKKVTWLSAPTPTASLTPVTLLDFDYLITKKKLEEDDTIDKFIAPVTEFREDAQADANLLANVKRGDTIQFERKGYYICDSVGGEGANARWEFILIPDGRAVTVESKAVMAKQAEEKAKGVAAPVEKVSKKERMAAAKKASAAVPGLSPTRVVLSDATTGFEIPVSTMVSYLSLLFMFSLIYLLARKRVDATDADHFFVSLFHLFRLDVRDQASVVRPLSPLLFALCFQVETDPLVPPSSSSGEEAVKTGGADAMYPSKPYTQL